MLKLFRTATYLLILSLALNVVEWPFVDEILAEQTQELQRSQHDAITSLTLPPNNNAVPSAAHDTAKHAGANIYHTLMDLLDIAPSLSFAAAQPFHPCPTSIEQHFASRTLPSIERPPRLSLS